MHGIIGTMQTPRNRKGRKRKFGRRTSSGQLSREKVDYRSMAAEQPHRKWLPAAHRLSERAGTNLGAISIMGLISEDQYNAGTRYSVLVGAYLAMANAPRGTAGNGKGYQCLGELKCDPDSCICLQRTTRYMRAYEAVTDGAGRQGHMAINHIVIHDRACSEDQLEHLRRALTALVDHFGLTKRGKSQL